MTDRKYVVVTTCGLGPEVDDIGPVYGPFTTEDDANYFASQLPDVDGYAKGSYWTRHTVYDLRAGDTGEAL